MWEQGKRGYFTLCGFRWVAINTSSVRCYDAVSFLTNPEQPMKTNFLFLTTLALLLTACDEPAPKPEKSDSTASSAATPQAAGAEKPAAQDEKASAQEKPAATDEKAAAQEKPAAQDEKPAAQGEQAAASNDAKDSPAEAAPPPTFKTADEALPYIQSQLPYDTKESSFRSASLNDGIFTFTGVIKGVEDAAAFRASHNMEGLASAYRETAKPYLCEQEPLKSLGEKKKYRGVHLSYQDEHGENIMQIDIAASDCAASDGGK